MRPRRNEGDGGRSFIEFRVGLVAIALDRVGHAMRQVVMQEIERHRGYRPKASVVLLYNRVLPPRAGERYWTDPTAALLRECAATR